MAEKKPAGTKPKSEKKSHAERVVKAAKANTMTTASKFGRIPFPNAKETNLIRRVSVRQPHVEIQEFRPGDTVNVYVRVKEGEKERVQLYKGVVTKVQGSGAAKSFTVRKISAGVGVERTFPFVSPSLDRVELVNTGKVRRSKLYYLRELEGKAAKIESEIAGQTSNSSTATEPSAAT